MVACSTAFCVFPAAARAFRRSTSAPEGGQRRSRSGRRARESAGLPPPPPTSRCSWASNAPSVRSMKMKLTRSSAPVVARARSSSSGTSSKRCPLEQHPREHQRDGWVVSLIPDSLEQVEPVAQGQLRLLDVSPLERELGLGHGHPARGHERAGLDEHLPCAPHELPSALRLSLHPEQPSLNQPLTRARERVTVLLCKRAHPLERRVHRERCVQRGATQYGARPAGQSALESVCPRKMVERLLARADRVRCPAPDPRLPGDRDPVLGKTRLVALRLENCAGSLPQTLALVSRELGTAGDPKHRTCSRRPSPRDGIGCIQRCIEDPNRPLVSSLVIHVGEIGSHGESLLVLRRKDSRRAFEERARGMEVPPLERPLTSGREVARCAPRQVFETGVLRVELRCGSGAPARGGSRGSRRARREPWPLEPTRVALMELGPAWPWARGSSQRPGSGGGGSGTPPRPGTFAEMTARISSLRTSDDEQALPTTAGDAASPSASTEPIEWNTYSLDRAALEQFALPAGPAARFSRRAAPGSSAARQNWSPFSAPATSATIS